MEKGWISFSIKVILVTSLTLFGFFISCKKKPPNKAAELQAQIAAAEIDSQKIIDKTGVRFKILKTDTRGYVPIHKFFWICVPDQMPKEKAEELVREIIKATIEKYPNTYHSFMVHLFYESEVTGRPEDCTPFARATFLPEGDWFKVGRSPIDDYKNYKLALEYRR